MLGSLSAKKNFVSFLNIETQIVKLQWIYF